VTVVPRHRWTFLLQPKWLCWHAFAVLATAGMLWLGDWQLRRAESGNELSWAYTVEWPLFAAFGLYFWARSIRDEARQAAGQPEPPAGQDAAAPEPPAAYADRLRAEVRGHGRWHGLR
jgi:DNA-binding transcriptional regulator of glucitol operon